MQTEQIVAAIMILLHLSSLVILGVVLKRLKDKEDLPQPDNKSYNTKKQKAEISSHGYNEIINLTDKRDASLVKTIEDDEED